MSPPEAEPGSGWGAPLAVASVAILLVVAFVFAAREMEQRRAQGRAFPRLEGEVAAAGLDAPATIVRDELGVPHVEAASERDAWFALGFVHAQDRLAQMVWLLRSARGRTAESIGPEGLETDRLARRLGFGPLADAEARRLDRATRAALDAYAAGVNARLASIRAGEVDAPAPLARLEVPLEPWTPADSVAVVKLLAWGLDGAVDESWVLWDLIQHLGGFGARPFFPPDAAGRLVPPSSERSASAIAPAPRTAALRRSLGLGGRSVGSSAWLVSSRLSASGHPLLAADTHLEPTVPALLHLAHLRAPGFQVAGACLPGAPVFWSGHNGRVAWAATHARAMVVDLFVETLQPSDPTRYHDGRRWRPLDVREETIAVRGEAPVSLRVRATRRGPLLDDRFASREPLAVAWPGARPGNGIRGLLQAARAVDADAFRRALSAHHEPVLTFLFADAGGGGGLQVAGFVPDRGIPSGLVPVPGRSRWSDWRGAVNLERLPRAELADRDWIVAADDAPPDGEEDSVVEWLWRPGERAQRIEALLRQARSRGPLDAFALAAMQRDVRSSAALARVRDALALGGPLEDLPREAREVAARLQAWEGRTDAGSVEAAAYHAFLLRLVRKLLGEPLGEERLERYLALRTASPEVLVGRLLAAARAESPGDANLADPQRVRRAVREALRETGLALLTRLGANRNKWTWGRLHPLVFRPLGWPAGSWGPQSRGPARPYGGDALTVAVGEYDLLDPFGVRVASTFRFVIDTADFGIALAALAPGALEHPGHPLRESGLDAWLEGRPTVLATNPVLIATQARARLRLEPAP